MEHVWLKLEVLHGSDGTLQLKWSTQSHGIKLKSPQKSMQVTL